MQVYEYDRNLLQQDSVQYIASYKYEFVTIMAALNMLQYVRKRAPLCRKQPRGAAGAGSSGGALLPRPGHGGRGGGAGQRSGGFSVANVLNAVSMGVGGQLQQQQQQQQQRAVMRTPPRSPSGKEKPAGRAAGLASGGRVWI